jgi:hypothetical protein
MFRIRSEPIVEENGDNPLAAQASNQLAASRCSAIH